MTQSSWSSPSPGGALDRPQPAGLADVLELVLDKGVVIAGDIKINLLEIELLTIKLRLLIASVDKAREMGIDWWESDPTLSSGPGRIAGRDDGGSGGEDNRELARRLAAVERQLGVGPSRDGQ
jgi:hypothetical protein